MGSGYIFLMVGFAVWVGFIALLVYDLSKDPKDKYGGHVLFHQAYPFQRTHNRCRI
jgi:hypothetical protein